MAEVEVKTKLTLDDAASSTLNRLKSGFKQTAEESSSANQATGFFKQTLSTLAAVNFVPAIQGAINFAKSFLDIARAGDSADQAVGGMITAMQGLPWAESRAQAEDLGDAIDEMAIRAGQSIDDVEGAFHSLLEIGGATKEGIQDALQRTQQFTTIANVLGKSAKTIAMEFAFMEDGMIRTRGQLANLLKQTGIFGNDIRKASIEWQKMSPEKRTELLNYGMKQLADTMSKAEPTFDDLVTQLKNVSEVAKEKFGEALMNSIKPHLQGLSKLLVKNRHVFEDLAKSMEGDVRRWVDQAAKAIQEGFEWIKTHKDEIREAIVKGVEKAKKLIDFILAHKEELAAIFGARVGMGALGGLAPAAASAVGAAGRGVGAVYQAGAGATTGLAGAVGGGVAGGAYALGALAAAIVGVGLAAEQSTKLIKEWRGGFFDAFSQMLSGGKAVDEVADAEARAARVRQYLADGELKRAEELISKMRGASAAQRKFADGLEQTTRAFRQQNAEMFKTVSQYEQHPAALMKADMAPLVDAYNQAATTGNVGMQKYIANLIAGSGLLSLHLSRSGLLLEGGLKGLGENVSLTAEEVSKQFLELMKSPLSMEKKTAEQLSSKPPAPKISIGGGNTFNIKQDFRDQDPDRVAVVFQRDVVRAAMSRLQSNRATVFGV